MRLKDAGLRLAALSDFPLSKKLEGWGLENLFEYQRSCEDIGYLKPNPEPFLDIAAYFGCTPREIVYVGNNYNYDIIGAKNSGLFAAHVTSKPVQGSQADFSFFDFRRLGDWVISL